MSIDLCARAIVSLILGFSSTAWAQDSQDFDAGKFEYQMACAACHATDGKGMGPVGVLFGVPPSDLTVLTKKNGGVFPLLSLYEVIDGRKMIEAHGARDMPIWGERFTPDLNRSFAPNAAEMFLDPSHDPETVVRNRILSLVEYINRIQEK